MAASYPAATKTFREKENLAGLNYDSNNKRTLFVEDLTQIEDEVIAIEEELGAEVSGDAETLADRLDDMEAATAAIMSAVYPVGSIYINASNSSNPNTLLGFGTWEAWGVGRAIVGIDTGQTEFDSGGKTGGVKAVTLTVNEIPAHNHRITRPPWRTAERASGNGTWAPDGGTYNWVSTTTTGDGGIGNTGGGLAHNNLQPYQVGYVWKRIE